jgi:UDP-glucose 4-epimerase
MDYSVPVRIIVTGAAGFIGSHLCERLVQEGHTVVGIDNLSVGRLKNLKSLEKEQNFFFHQADIQVLDDIVKLFKNADQVVHMAARADIVPSIENPDDYFSSNVIGTYNVVRASQASKVQRFVYIASSSCYGIPKQYPTPESAEIDPQYPYALTKYLGEQIVMHWAKVYDLPAISFRFFNVYGPRARTSGTYGAVFGVFLAQKLAQKPFTVVGDGNQTRDFTYVSDVIDAILIALNSKNTGIYNVGSGNTYSVNYLVELLGGEKQFIPRRPGEPDSTFAEIKKIKKELGWSPKTSLEDGVKEMLKNISEWQDAPVWDASMISNATKNWFKYLGNKNA